MTEVVELYVVMHCEACAAAVRRAIRKIPGVESYKLDLYGQRVTVIGKVDRDDVWRRIQKTGKRVTLIPKPDPPKQEKKEEKKEAQKEEKKEEQKKEKAEEKEEEKTEEKEEAKKEKTTLVRKKSTYWPAVRLWRFLIPREVKIHEKEEVVKLVEKTEEKQEVDAKGDPEKGEAGKEKKKENKTKKVKEPEWVPLLVTAPFYTLPTSVY